MTGDSQTVGTRITSHLRGLSRALVQRRTEEVYAHHKELYLIGREVVPFVAEQLLAYSWTSVKYGEQLSLLSGLLGLVQDIDEDAARQIVGQIEEKGCSKPVQRIMHSILSFSLAHFERLSIEGVAVYRSEELDGAARSIEKKMARWLRSVPGPDLEGIDRIYVIPSCGPMARGTYTPILCTIAIEWDVPPNPLFRWLSLLMVETTLYHEIGHHVRRHRRLGQEPDQEDEADDYAKKIMRKNHPFIRRSARVARILSGRAPLGGVRWRKR